MYPDVEVLKTHTLDLSQAELNSTSKIIISVRDPRDSISSSIQRYKKEPTIDVVKEQIKEFKEHGMQQVLDVCERGNVLVLKYEDFAFNIDKLFSEVELFMGESVTKRKKRYIKDAFAIENMDRKSKALGDFENYDKSDHIHGRHISQFKGKVGYYQNFLSIEMIDVINESFPVFMKKFGYLR
jgi:hypothetical protein